LSKSIAPRNRLCDTALRCDVSSCRTGLEGSRNAPPELDAARDNMNALAKQVDSAREIVAAKDAELDAARGNVEALAAQIDRAREGFAAKDAELDAARGNINALVAEIGSAREAHAVRDAHEAALRAELAALRGSRWFQLGRKLGLIDRNRR